MLVRMYGSFAVGFALVLTALNLMPVLDTHASTVVNAVPGNTVVRDPIADFQLRNCDLLLPDRPCSLPPGAPLALPAWADIRKAQISQVGKDRVDLVIAVADDVPQAPPFGFLAYFWTFENGCIGEAPGPTNKDALRVVWNGATWSANWVTIINCVPRMTEIGDEVPFRIVNRKVRIRVPLNELITRAGEPVLWHAGVRRLPFDNLTFSKTVAVDVAPDVFAFNPIPPPLVIFPDEPASWVPRSRD
jgi:hypothetical protein